MFVNRTSKHLAGGFRMGICCATQTGKLLQPVRLPGMQSDRLAAPGRVGIRKITKKRKTSSRGDYIYKEIINARLHAFPSEAILC